MYTYISLYITIIADNGAAMQKRCNEVLSLGLSCNEIVRLFFIADSNSFSTNDTYLSFE